MKKFIFTAIVFLGITVFFYSVASIPIIRNYQSVPKELFYYPTEPMALDFLGYLTIVEKGFEGTWQRYFDHWIDPQLRAKQSFTLAQIEYVLLGHLSRIMNIEPYIMMIGSRIVLSFLLCLFVWWFFSKIFTSIWKKAVAYGFFLFATSITLPWNVAEMSMPVVYFFIGNTFERYILTKQHHILAAITLLPAIYYIAQSFDGKHWKRSLGIGSAFLLLTTHFYSPGTIVAVSIFILCIIFRMSQKSGRLYVYHHWKRLIGIFIIIGIVSLVPIIHISQTVQLFYPTEKYGYLWSGHQLYILAVGTLYLVSLLGVPKLLKSTSFFHIFIGMFTIMHPIISFLFQPLLGRSMRRAFEIPYQAFFAISAIYGIVMLSELLRRKFQIKQSVVVLGAVIFVFLPSIKTYSISLPPDCFCNYPPFDYGYPKKDYINVFRWLKNNTKPEDVILSGHHSGTLIGAFAGNAVMTNWWMRMEDVNYWEYDLLRAFFPRKDMSDNGALKLLAIYDAKYVFYGEEEKTLSKGIDKLGFYPFLKLAYQSGDTKIYKVVTSN